MARNLAVIGFDGVHLSSVGLFLDLFDLVRRRVADQFRSRDDIGMQTLARLLGQSGHAIRAAGDRRLDVDAAFTDDMMHMLIHVPEFEWPEGEIANRIAELQPTVKWLAGQHARGAHISATGRGVYLLAEGGLLGDGPAPIYHSETAAFRGRFPRIPLDKSSAIVERGTIVMARGRDHEMTMLVRLIARLMSPAMAGSIAKSLGREEFEKEGLSSDRLVAEAQIWLSESSARESRISVLARHLAVSQQTLIRHFRAELGMTPRDYLRVMRVQNAQSQLRETRRPISQIATLAGYDDLKSFQHAFRTLTGMSASTYRRQHQK